MPYCLKVGVAISKSGLTDVEIIYDWDDSPNPQETGYYICILDVCIGEKSIADELAPEVLAFFSKRIGLTMIDHPPTPEERATNDAEMVEDRAKDPVHRFIKSGDLESLARWNEQRDSDIRPIFRSSALNH